MMLTGRIIDAGFPTSLWARRPATLEPFADTAAKVAGSPAELAAASDLVCLCVVGDSDVEEITSGDDGVLAGLKPGGVIAVHSTVHPKTCHELAKKAGERWGAGRCRGPSADDGRRRRRRCRTVSPGVRKLCRPDRAPGRSGVGANHQAVEQLAVHRQPGDGGHHIGARRGAGFRPSSASTSATWSADRSSSSTCSRFPDSGR